MANELTLNARLQVSKGSLSLDRNTSTFKADMSGTHASLVVQAIPTAYTAISINSSVATPGWAYFKNLDATNYCEVGLVVASTFYPMIRLKPGFPQLVYLATGTIYAKANTAATDVEFCVIEA